MVLERVVIDAPRSFDSHHTERDALRIAITGLLAHDSTVTVAANRRDMTHVAQVVLGEAQTASDGNTTRVVEVRLRPIADATEFVASKRVAEQDDVVQTGLEGFRGAWDELLKLRRLDVAPDQTLVTALQDTDPTVREFAIARVGDRRLRTAVEPLCRALTTETEPALMLKAVGALVSIGDPRAVEPLIELSHQKDPAFVLQIAFAVGAIGGRTAQGYLVTLAGGHPDEDVRRGAKDALDELTRRHGGNARP